MINISIHIAYLLTKHECVVIPDFGAFVVSPHLKNQIKTYQLKPTFYLVGFNPEIIHNDGLLANSIANIENITFKEASLKVKRYANDLKKELREKEFVQISWVGRLSHSNGKIIFTPSMQLSCNAFYYGLNAFYMPTLSELNTINENSGIELTIEKKDLDYIRLPKSGLKKGLSVAAALLAFFFISTPLNDHLILNTQHASVISIPSHKMMQKNLPVEPELNVLLKENCNEEITVDKTFKRISRSYFIVIASLPTLDMANKKLKEIQQKEFPDANITSSGDKNRIYIQKFNDKTHAEEFLIKFRNDYPQYAKAWLLSQRSSN